MEPVTSPAQKNCQGSTIKIISDETTSRQQPPNPHHQPSIPWMFHPHSLQMALNSSLVSPSLYSTLICQPNKHLVHAEETFLQPKEQLAATLIGNVHFFYRLNKQDVYMHQFYQR